VKQILEIEQNVIDDKVECRVKETPRERFNRVGTRRLLQAREAMRKLRTLAKGGSAVDPVLAARMISELDADLAALKLLLQDSLKSSHR